MLPRHILVATDFSPHSDAATRWAIELALKTDARVHLLHSYEVPMLGAGPTDEWFSALATQLETDALKGLDTELARNKTPGVGLDGLIKRSDPRDAIIEAARELHAELIVMGTHGRRAVRHALMGSVAEWVVRHAPCPVLTVRAGPR